MSNVIKAYSVRYDEVTKITIDTHFKIDHELEVKRSEKAKAVDAQSDEFVEGLNALVIDAVPSEQETSEKAAKIIEDAKAEAKEIIEIAKKEAEKIKNEAFSTAQKNGYEEGILKVKREAMKLKEEYEEKETELSTEYEALASSLEPKMVQILSDLLGKMTGILVNDQEDVIGYLIKKAMKNMDKSDSYTIRVSEEDYAYVNAHKDDLIDAVGGEATLVVTNDQNLERYQCLIETDQKVINCSLDNQLNNLITDLKLLGGI